MAAEPGDDNFVSKLDEEGRCKAKEELNELNDNDNQIAVQTLRQWVLDQDWLKTPTDFTFLLRFLTVRKFIQLGARETLENYWKGRTNTPEWFRDMDPSDEIMQEILRSGCYQCPKKCDKMGRRVFLLKFYDVNFISRLDEEGKKKAKVELQELNDKDTQIAVQTLRQWVLDQDWLKTPTDFGFLLRFLRVRKFSQLGARETLENYWKGRTNAPEWFRNVDPTDELVKEVIQSGAFQCPKKYDKQGRRMYLCKVGLLSLDLIKRVGVDNIYKASFLVYDWLLLDEKVQVNGIFVVVDYTNYTLPQMMATMTAETSRKSTPLIQKALPMRLKGIHLYNEPTFIDLFMSLVTPFLRQKIKDRFIMHGKSLVKFYEDVGMEIIPDEYLPDDYKGPCAGCTNKIIDDMMDDMMKPEFREYIKNLSSDKYGVDKEKRKTHDEPSASFRKLHVS